MRSSKSCVVTPMWPSSRSAFCTTFRDVITTPAAHKERRGVRAAAPNKSRSTPQQAGGRARIPPRAVGMEVATGGHTEGECSNLLSAIFTNSSAIMKEKLR